VQAYFDGELDASAAMEIERHLESCVGCASLLADLEATRKLIRRESPYFRVNPDLRGRHKENCSIVEEGVVQPVNAFPILSRPFSVGRGKWFAGAMALAATLAVFFCLYRSLILWWAM